MKRTGNGMVRGLTGLGTVPTGNGADWGLSGVGTVRAGD
jgi:hypothetical protein